MDIPRNYHLEDKVEYIIALVNEERMIRLSGVKGIEIRFTGLRDGEKLYEEVLNEEETSKPTFHPKIKIAQVRAYDYADANLRIDALSVDTITNFLVPYFTAKSAITRVPSTLLRTLSSGLSSIIGTCL